MGLRTLLNPLLASAWRGRIKDPEVPPPTINYNQIAAWNATQYVGEFKRNACLRELPFLMREAALKPSSTMLDYGCGLGRLAFPASKYLSDQGTYFGYEPNPDALSFLRTVYSGRHNFHFSGKPLPRDEDYIAIASHTARPEGTPAMEVDLSFVDRPIDVQWSSSVFTHMWIDPIVRVLESITRVLSPQGVCVNTWLCVDDFAAYSLACGVADRNLSARVNGALTTDAQNPLRCTAYELGTVEEIYRRANHKIIDIRWGSWSGRDNGTIYQDIVVSKPK